MQDNWRVHHHISGQRFCYQDDLLLGRGPARRDERHRRDEPQHSLQGQLIQERRSAGPPLRGIGKVIGVGLNYRDHAEETGLPLPKEPTLFLKVTSALCGPADDLVMPREGKSGFTIEPRLAENQNTLPTNNTNRSGK
jgi:2-keto-4-pentenoate hydratase/2-oxohepta-3-ene-1,7-dioic acid hydratase in catechol pathway